MVKKIKRKKPVRKWVKHLKRYFSKEETQMANRYIKKKGNSTSLLSRKCKYKTTVWYYLITAGMVSIKGQKIPSTSKDVEKLHCDPKNHSTTGCDLRHHKLSITNSRSLPKPVPIKLVMPSISSSVTPFSSCPQSLPASGSFPMSQLFAWGSQRIGISASTSVLPMNTQDWSALGRTGWISLQSKGLSRVFPNTTVQKYQFFGTQLSLPSNSHIHTWPLEKP